MKILQVLPALDSGGVERGTLEIAEALVRNGHESWVLSAGGRLVAPLEAAGSRHMAWDLGKKSPRTIFQIRPFRSWLHRQNFDIVHVRSRLPAWVTYLALRKLPEQARPRFVTTMHGLHSVSRYSAIMTRGERVVAVSETCRRYILENYPATDPDRIRLIHRGIDPDIFPRPYYPSAAWLRDWYDAYPQLQGRFVVTLPGRLTRLKGHLDWLAAMARLRVDIPNLAGLIVGGESADKAGYAEEVRDRIRSEGLESVVFMTGHREDIREIYALSDVVLSLSTKPESFGRTVLEPLAMGVPVVGYARGGVAEILADLYPEGAVTPGDLPQVVQAIKRIHAGDAADVRVNEHFLLHNMQAQTLALYEELVDS
jgi:glycosyltransferase involved in cell wall biosynthesis